MNRASPQGIECQQPLLSPQEHRWLLRRIVEVVLSDETAFPDEPASMSGKGLPKTITAKAEPLSLSIVTENRG